MFEYEYEYGVEAPPPPPPARPQAVAATCVGGGGQPLARASSWELPGGAVAGQCVAASHGSFPVPPVPRRAASTWLGSIARTHGANRWILCDENTTQVSIYKLGVYSVP